MYGILLNVVIYSKKMRSIQIEQIGEIMDKREPKQNLLVKNSNISESEFIDCKAENVIFHDISLPHVKVTYADLRLF